MSRLGYGLEDGRFTVNGVEASGSFNTANLIGLDLADVKGSINTFDGEEEYDFSLDLDVFSLFKAEAELQLKRLNSGELMPNNLYFYVNAKPGIPLVPPAPVVQLTGGGAGFYNLADTINGNWYAIPANCLPGHGGCRGHQHPHSQGSQHRLWPWPVRSCL